MADSFETDSEKKVCLNCQYMQPLLGKNPNDNFPCNYLHKMIENIQNNFCPNWVKRKLNSII